MISLNSINQLAQALVSSDRSSKTFGVKSVGKINYTHRLDTRARSYKLKIDPRVGLIAVTPKNFSQSKLDAFVSINSVWINKNLSKITQKKSFFETEKKIRIFDEEYQKIIKVDAGRPSSIKLDHLSENSLSDLNGNTKELINNARNSVAEATTKNFSNPPPKKINQQTTPTLVISVPAADAQKIQSLINRFLQQTAEYYITTKTREQAKKMQLDYTKISYGEHRSQWGSCHVSGALTFNWRLVHAPVKIIDYVIIHELSHRVHHNHSRAFWALVAKYDPHYESHRRWLKKNGMSVG
jgi:predicted metal-dependent hydrolase